MLLSVPVPGTQEAVDWDNVTLWPNQNAKVPMDISVSLIQFIVVNILKITVCVILKFPKFRLIIMLVLPPRLECWRLKLLEVPMIESSASYLHGPNHVVNRQNECNCLLYQTYLLSNL